MAPKPSDDINDCASFLSNIFNQVAANLGDKHPMQKSILDLAAIIDALEPEDGFEETLLQYLCDFFMEPLGIWKVDLLHQVWNSISESVSATSNPALQFLEQFKGAEHSKKGLEEVLKLIIDHLSRFPREASQAETFLRLQSTVAEIRRRDGDSSGSKLLTDLFRTGQDEAFTKQKYEEIIAKLNNIASSANAAQATTSTGVPNAETPATDVPPSSQNQHSQEAKEGNADSSTADQRQNDGREQDRPGGDGDSISANGYTVLAGPWYLVNYHSNDGCDHLMLSSVNNRKRRRISISVDDNPAPNKAAKTTVVDGKLQRVQNGRHGDKGQSRGREDESANAVLAGGEQTDDEQQRPDNYNSIDGQGDAPDTESTRVTPRNAQGDQREDLFVQDTTLEDSVSRANKPSTSGVTAKKTEVPTASKGSATRGWFKIDDPSSVDAPKQPGLHLGPGEFLVLWGKKTKNGAMILQWHPGTENMSTEDQFLATAAEAEATALNASIGESSNMRVTRSSISGRGSATPAPDTNASAQTRRRGGRGPSLPADRQRSAVPEGLKSIAEEDQGKFYSRCLR